MPKKMKTLPVVEREECKKCAGGYHYRRLDNHGLIIKEGDLEVLAEPPILIVSANLSDSPIFEELENVPKKANALLKGSRFRGRDYDKKIVDYFSMSYCRIKGLF